MSVDIKTVALAGVVALGVAFVVVGQYAYAGACLTGILGFLAPSPVGGNNGPA